MTVTTAAGDKVEDPTRTQLHDLLADMNHQFPFLILTRHDRSGEGDHYIQVHLMDDGEGCLVEFREGGPETHRQGRIPSDDSLSDVEPVARLLGDWAADAPGWREAAVWRPWTPETDALAE